MAEIKDTDIVKYKSNKVELQKAPSKGDNVSVYVRPGDEIDFLLEGINLEDLNYKLVGGDIIIDIPNQGSFTFVSMALMGYNDTPPSFNFGGGVLLTLDTILSAIEEVNDLPLESISASLQVKIDQEAREESPKTEPQPIIIIQDISELVDADAYPEENENIGEYTEALEEIEVEENLFTASETKSSSKNEEAVTEGIKPILTFDIDIQHLSSTSSTNANIVTVEGGGGTSYDNIYPGSNDTASRSDIVKQTNTETIDYRNVSIVDGDKLVINADNSNYFDTDAAVDADTDIISRVIELSPNQPVGFAMESITVSSNDFPIGFSILGGTKSGNGWVLKQDNPDTEAIEGFTLDASGNIEIKISMNRNQVKNFEMKISGSTTFSMENIPEDQRLGVETPLETTLEFSKNYGVNVKEIEEDKLDDPSEYLFNSFLDSTGNSIDSGFVITTNINDNIIYGSETIANEVNGGLAKDTVITGIANDTISTNSGDDTITSGLGDDTIDGGEGSDTLDFSSIDNADGTGVNANLVAGTVTGDGTDTISKIENVTGTQGQDIIIGDGEINILKGEGGKDTIEGGAGDDTIEGGDGDDTVEGGAGEDILKGDAGKDTVSYENAGSGVTVLLDSGEGIDGKGSAQGGAGTDELWSFENVKGSNSDDTITGNDASNIIEGLAGDDHIYVSSGNDTIDGGTNGVKGDTIDASNSAAAHTINLRDNQVFGEGYSSITGIENVIGSNGKDIITGNDDKNTLLGGISSDIIKGEGGDDHIEGGTQDDTLSGGLGDDYIDGGSGSDGGNGDTADYSDISGITDDIGVTVDLRIQDGTAQDTVKAGNDTLKNIENLIGTIYADTLHGDSNDNTLLGGSGNDTLFGNGSTATGNDYIDGGSGTDDLISFKTVTSQGITFDLADTSVQDTGVGRLVVKNVENLEGSTLNDTLYGSSQANKLYGYGGDDTLDGRAGIDTIEGGEGDDTLIGGTGDDFLDGGTHGTKGDTVDYSYSSDAVKLTLAEGDDVIALATLAGGEIDKVTNIENITGSQSSDTLSGNSGKNILDGQSGDDSFIASDGEDTLKGATGNDTLDYSARGTLNGTDGIEVTLNGDSESILEENGTAKDHLYSIENITGSQANDIITGDDSNNILKGDKGDDTLKGGLGSDYLVGGENTTGDGSGDTVDYSYISDGSNTNGVNVNLDSTNADKGTGLDLNTNTSDTLEGIENVIGSSNNDIISGNSANNTLDGRGGDDTLQGGAGDDVFLGGTGIDTVDYQKLLLDKELILLILSRV